MNQISTRRTQANERLQLAAGRFAMTMINQKANASLAKIYVDRFAKAAENIKLIIKQR